MKCVKKFDTRPKLDGSWKFVDDYTYDNMLYGQLLYSKCHHGYIKKITFPSNYDLSEFTMVSPQDILGENIVPEPVCDQPYMVDKEIMHFGQVIMGIAHSNRKLLRKFINETIIEYDELPAITGIKECLENEENHFGEETIVDHTTNKKPDPNWIYNHNVYYTPHQEQAYLETQGVISVYDPKESTMFVLITAQCPFFVKTGVEAILGDTVKKVIIESPQGIGGAFGGKEDFPSLLAGINSLLSYKSGRPVKMILDRSDDIQITTKRHPARVELETWTDPETKKIKRCRIDYRIDTGAYQTLSPVVLSRGVLHSIGGYYVPDTFIRGRMFKSNTPSNGAFRGFGAPQAFAAMEAHIDRIAADINVDPYEFRKINLFRIGDEFPTTQKIVNENLSDCLERVILNSDYQKKNKEFAEWNKTHKDKKGIGIAVAYHGGGYTGNGEKILESKIKVTIDKDAMVKIYVANTDMGQGAHTTLAQMFYEAIGHPRDKCWVQVPNTSKTPNSGPTVASRTIYIIGNLLRKLAFQLKDELGFDNLEKYVKTHQNEFPQVSYKTFTSDPSVVFDENTNVGIAYKDYSWAACANEIYFYADTCKIELKKSWNVLDVGKLVNEKIAMGQAQGGILQGLGYGLSEFFYKPGYGRVHGFTDYVLPTSLDLPEMNIEFIHTDSDLAKGLGEIPMNFPAPSMRNAFHNATGIFIDEYPLIPERLFKAMEEQK